MRIFFKAIIFSLFFITYLIFGTSCSFAQNYYVSNSGSDKNLGTSPDLPWESIAKVNSFNFAPGDVVHFKCGDTWREQLVPVGGSPQGAVKYTSYGIGEKPLLLGSVSKNNLADWENEGGNIWSIATPDNKVVSQKSISIYDTTFWAKEKNSAYMSIIPNGSGGECLKLYCNYPLSSIYDTQLMTEGLNVRNGKSYVFSFRAKSTVDFAIPSVRIIKSTSPWTDLFSFHSGLSQVVTSDWATYRCFYVANYNDDNAMANIFLGVNFPPGATLYIDSIEFYEVENPDIYHDVGNVILDHGTACGTKVFSTADLKKQNDFFYDSQNRTLKMYSLCNPAEIYSSIEFALDKHIIDINNKSYITIDNLALKYGSSCGIFAINTHHIEIFDCDISYIGGSVLEWKNGRAERYGNGVNFINNTHDNIVEGCSIWEIYDAALTNQGSGDGVRQYNIIYKNNNIWNAEWSYEYWNDSINGLTSDIYFDNNICQYAGYGWGHSQRPNPSGMHICFPDNAAQTSRVYITNNVFKYSTTCHLYVSKRWEGKENLMLENNKYIQYRDGIVVTWGISEVYYVYNFGKYKEKTGKDSVSVSLYQ